MKEVSKAAKDQIRQLKLNYESYSAFEAQELILTIIEQKINRCKLQYLRKWEKNHELDSSELEREITELNNQKKALQQVIGNAKAAGKKLLLNGNLELNAVN